MWVQQCGHAWLKVSWDVSEGQPLVDPTLPPGSFNGYEGEVRVEVVSPFEIFPDPMAKCEEDVLRSWIIQAKVRKLDYFKTQYPEKGELVKEEEAWLLSAQYEQKINSINSRGPSQGGMQDQMKNSAIEMVKYEARSKDYPNGRMIVCANGILLEDKELPVGVIPFRKFDDVTIGGKLYSEAVITHLRPLQEQYNENERRISAWMNKFVAGKYKAARGSGLAPEALHDGESEVVYYDAVPNAGAPEAMEVPQLPQYVFQHKESLDHEMSEIAGISEVSKGQMPSASIPAIGMQLLTEQDDTRIGVMTEQHEHSWAGVGGLILRYVEKFYVTPRKLKLAGKGLEYTVKQITGDMLKGNTDVYVIRGSTLPGSKTLKRQEVINAWQQGMLGPQQDPRVIEKLLGMIEFGDTSEMWEDYGLDQSQIKRGIDRMEQGEAVFVDKRDNHPLWMQEINRYRKQEKWNGLDPQVQDLFNQCFDQHVDCLISLSNTQQQPMPPDPDQQPLPGGDPAQPQPGEQPPVGV